MYRAYTKIKDGLCLIGVILLMGSCFSIEKRTVHKSYTIEIKGMQFQPSEIHVNKGDTIIWVNRDMVTHDVTEETHKTWTSLALSTGKSWSLVPTQSADYYCSIHVVMKGKIIVE